jgi:photosystem II stability/assembly factor-like uncharacterized protein
MASAGAGWKWSSDPTGGRRGCRGQSLSRWAGRAFLVVWATVLAGCHGGKSAGAPPIHVSAPPVTSSLPQPYLGVEMAYPGVGLLVTASVYTMTTTVWRSVDEGVTWRPIQQFDDFAAGSWWWSRSRRGTVWLEGIQALPTAMDPQAIRSVLWVSHDGGATWQSIVPEVPPGGGRIWTQLTWATRSRGWAVTLAGRLLKTEDGGLSWTPVVWFRGRVVSAVDAVNATTAWVLQGGEPGGAGGRVWHTADGGRTWREATPPGTVTAIAFTTPTRGLAAGARRQGGAWVRTVWATDNGGATWTASDLGRAPAEGAIPAAVEAGPGALVWAGAEALQSPPGFFQNLWVSRDRGRTWRAAKIAPRVIGMTVPEFLPDGQGWMVVAERDRAAVVYGLDRWRPRQRAFKPLRPSGDGTLRPPPVHPHRADTI